MGDLNIQPMPGYLLVNVQNMRDRSVWRAEIVAGTVRVNDANEDHGVFATKRAEVFIRPYCGCPVREDFPTLVLIEQSDVMAVSGNAPEVVSQ